MLTEILRYKLLQSKTKMITYANLTKNTSTFDYKEICESIEALMAQGLLEPVKAAGGNGRNPALPKKYRIKIEQDKSDIREEIRGLHPEFKVLQYMNNIAKYEADRDVIYPISQFLHEQIEELQYQIDCNERALQIWGYEKYLMSATDRARVNRVLADNDIDEGFLNYYVTAQPFPYFISKRDAGKALIVENKATFGSLERLDEEMVLPYAAVILGNGRMVTTQQHIDEFLQDVEKITGVDISECDYFGDLDPVGIDIMQRVIGNNETPIRPEQGLYRKLIEHARKRTYPQKKKQSSKVSLAGLDITKEDEVLLRNMFEAYRFVPQEAANKRVLQEYFANKQGEREM